MATEADNVNPGALGTLLAVGAFVTLGIALVLTALVRSEMSEELQKKDVGADQSFHDLLSEQSAKLNAPAAYVDRDKGLVSLPIERAMELVVSGLKKDPNSATPGGAATTGSAGSGGSAATGAATGGSGGMGGGQAKPPDEAINAEPGTDGAKPEPKKQAPIPPPPPRVAPAPATPVPPAPGHAAPAPAPAPVAPAPAAPAPAAPAPAPNGQ